MEPHASFPWTLWSGGGHRDRPRDIFYLTKETQFSLHRSTPSLPRSWSLRRRLLGNERRQSQQVFNAEVRTTGRRPHEQIRRRYARPCCRQVSKLAPVMTKADAVFSPSEVLVYEPELTSVEGVKDMRNQEGLRPIKRYECS
jgi:hypothetical protein